MSYRAARNQLVSIVSSTTPSVVSRGLPAKFKHDDNGGDSDSGDSRRYWLSTTAGHGIAPFTTSTRLMSSSIELVVAYCGDAKSSELDVAIVDDAALLIARLSNGSLWGRPTSTIQAVSVPGDKIAPFTIAADGAQRLLKIKLEVRYTRD